MADVADVLREMDEVVNLGRWPGDDGAAAHVRRWLAVLRPTLQHQDPRNLGLVPDQPPPNPNVESFPLKSDLPASQLRDLHMHVHLNVDHEGGGAVQFEYSQVPHQHRLQALLSVMGAIGNRIELAIGAEAYIDLLRGVAARRESR